MEFYVALYKHIVNGNRIRQFVFARSKNDMLVELISPTNTLSGVSGFIGDLSLRTGSASRMVVCPSISR